MVTPRRVKNAFQSFDMNCGPRSETISSEIPYYLKTELNSSLAVTMAVGRPLRGRRRQVLEKRSMTTSTHVLQSEAGRSVMKSSPRCDQGRLGMGSGRSLPDGRWRGLLEMAHSEQRIFSHPWSC